MVGCACLDSAVSNGSLRNSIVAHDQTNIDRPRAFQAGMLAMAEREIASIICSFRTLSFAKAQAAFDMFNTKNSSIFVIAGEEIA